jgi:DNA topoisomerase-1
MLKAKKLLKNKQVHRVVFHEITKKAVTHAIDNPGEIATTLVQVPENLYPDISQ